MLASLIAMAAMSQALRTSTTVVAADLQRSLALSADQISLVASAFHFAFALVQIPAGVALDVYGVRRTLGAAGICLLAGALLCACAPSLPLLLAGQVLTGIGCSPAFAGTLFFVARRYPPERFAKISGLALSLSGLGLLATGTPLAWVVEHGGWRSGYAVLAAAAGLVLAAVAGLVRDRPEDRQRNAGTPWAALAGVGQILRQRHTAGILALSLVGYASYIALRGLWAAPLLVARHGFSLTEAGHVLLASSLAALLGAPLFGHIRAGAAARRRWIVAACLLTAVAFAGLAAGGPWWLDAALCVLVGLLAGFSVLQFADAKEAYPREQAGRAFGVFNTVSFLGVALVQWATGLAAGAAAGAAADPFAVAFLLVAASLAAGVLAFAVLPRPPACAGRAA